MALGGSQVLSQWPSREKLSKVVVTSFSVDPPESLQAAFLRPFESIEIADTAASSKSGHHEFVSIGRLI